MNKFHFITFAALMLFFSSCFEDDLTDTTITSTFTPEETTVHNIEGIVVDEEGAPLKGALIAVDQLSIFSNEQGQFIIRNISIPESGAHFSAEADDKILAGTKFYNSSSLRGTIQISMKDRELDYSYLSNEGGSFEDVDGALIHLPPGGVLKDGASYEGEVFVNFQLDNLREPLSIENYDLLGDDGSIDKTMPIRRFYIALTDSDGNLLEIDPANPIVVVFPGLSSNGNDEQSLYRFDSQTNYWQRQADVAIADGFADLDVIQSGWYQVARQANAATLCLTFSANGGSSDNQDIFYVRTEADEPVYVGFVEYDAEICFSAPQSETVLVEIYVECFPLSQTVINLSSEDLQREEILVDLSFESYTIRGRILDCNGEEFNEEISLTFNAGQDRLIGEFTGSYQFLTEQCDQLENASLVLFQEESQTLVTIPIGALNEGVNDIDLSFCPLSEGQTYFNIEGAIEQGSTALQNKDETLIRSTSSRSVIGFDGFDVGVYSARFLGSDSYEGSVEITSYEGLGGIVAGTFKGSRIGNDDEMITVSFRSERIK